MSQIEETKNLKKTIRMIVFGIKLKIMQKKLDVKFWKKL